MKRTVKMISLMLLVLSISIALLSCGNAEKKEQNANETEVENTTENTVENKGEKYYVYDKMLCYANGTWLQTVEWEYDDKGNVTKEINTFNGIGDPSITTTVFTYGESSRLEKSTRTNEECSWIETTTYSYDENGNLTHEDVESSTGDKTVTIHTYDANGRKTKTVFAPKGDLNTVTEFTYVYNEKGYLVKKSEKHYLGVESAVEYTYDDNGRLAKEILSKISNIVYKYNEKGILTETVYTHVTGETVTTYTYEGEHIFYK